VSIIGKKEEENIRQSNMMIMNLLYQTI